MWYIVGKAQALSQNSQMKILPLYLLNVALTHWSNSVNFNFLFHKILSNSTTSL